MIALFCLSSLLARPTLVVKAEEESLSYALLAGVAERVAEHSLLSRMEGEGVLSISLYDLLETEPNALSATILFSYGEVSLELCIRSKGKDARHLERALEKKLSSMLLYDGSVLFDTGPSPLVDYTYTHGYASLSSLSKGDRYVGLDAGGQRWATVEVLRSLDGEEGPVSLLVGTSGKELLPGMRLEKQAGKSLSLSVSTLLGKGPTPRVGIEGLYGQEVGIYPFGLVLGGGFDLSGTAFSSVYAQAGLSVHLPLSMAFGLEGGFWRNSSLAMRCTLGLGYSLAESDLLFGSNALFLYQYHLRGYCFEVGLGNKYWASEQSTHSSGLFMQLGLTYTW